MHFIVKSTIILIITLSLFGCANSQKWKKEISNYSNPVFEPILADPTVVKDPSTGCFYAYGTQDDWGDGQGSRLVPILKSRNLVNWEVVGEAFLTKPKWKRQGGIWAPDVVYVGGKYMLYYAYSTWGDSNPGIGVAVSSEPEGPFTDRGKLFDSEEVGVPNSIDPFYFQDNESKYLFWGSFSNLFNQGTYGIPLDDLGLNVVDLSDKFKVAAGDFEAVVIHKRQGYYYFLGSKGTCCEGEKSTYHVMVARSKSLKGPYLDKEGQDIAEPGNGSLLLKKNKKFVGVGHTSRIITDDDGDDWILYHGIDSNRGKVNSGASRRVLLLDKIIWEDGWPKISDETPSTTAFKAPYFKSRKK
ncbi:family 43 glycosylhydrolase [Sphingobacterium sp. UT-1RO-CII-1]|uniref:family 43 glycosylhydrolase n=1 Tax=Sphingobacterium sp. UT-1RO-CII-1 TaxID=2995225 RepID=UPI00227CE95A|nr:family 43 glycosylhydrolase [Sphingobacterium sp. UT-1RO-CII-1]MCY4780115.1 family 43 glycosylhydrolase [Sphingobacterium sp. UT-1RO-CII-1]